VSEFGVPWVRFLGTCTGDRRAGLDTRLACAAPAITNGRDSTHAGAAGANLEEDIFRPVRLSVIPIPVLFGKHAGWRGGSASPDQWRAAAREIRRGRPTQTSPRKR